MSNITPTHLAYYHICHRKLWLFHHGMQMEHNSETVGEGKLVHETSYSRRSGRFAEIEVGGAKIDHFDPVENVVHEVKKSDKMEEAHLWQVKHYLYLLHQHGIENARGILEYPKLRQTQEVWVEEGDFEALETMLAHAAEIVKAATCPPRLTKKTFCRKCSYFDFCWVEE